MDPQQRLEHLIRSYPNDFQSYFDKYAAVCKKAGLPEKPFKTDASLIKTGGIFVCTSWNKSLERDFSTMNYANSD